MSVQLFPEATPEQRLLADSAIRVMAANYPPTAVREFAERAEPGDQKLWRLLGGVGCFRLLASEDDGVGTLSGNGVADAAIIAAERGARLQPGPFVGTHVVIAALSRAASRIGATSLRADALAALLAGDAVATWAVNSLLAGSLGSGLSVRQTPRGVALSGAVAAVQDADECDWILVSAPVTAPVTALVGDGVRQFLVARSAAGLSLEKAVSLDLTRRHFRLVLDDVLVPADAVLGDPDHGAELADWQLAVAAVLSAAESVGTMDANFSLALDYAKTRIAFGRPIGSFQGLKHLLARTSLALEMAKAVVAGAAEALGADAADGPAMASIARAFVSENAVQLAHNCFQVFGGIGFTWEHDQHLYLRRLASESHLFGGPSWHRQRIWQQSSSAGNGMPAGDGTREAADA